MALEFEKWERNTSKYVIYGAFCALVFFATQFVWQSYERESILVKEIIKIREDYESKLEKKDIKIEKLIADKDSLFKLVGEVNAINQLNLLRK